MTADVFLDLKTSAHVLWSLLTSLLHTLETLVPPSLSRNVNLDLPNNYRTAFGARI